MNIQKMKKQLIAQTYFIEVINMRIHEVSCRDIPFRCRYNYMGNFSKDVELLDKAHKRAKKELRKQQKALAKKNEYIKCYKEMYDNLIDKHNKLHMTLEDIQDTRVRESEEKIRQLNDISNLELKVTCLEQENKTLRKEHSKTEYEVQARIIQSMNDTIIELREQLTETEEKYNKLLKQISSEK